MTRTPLEPRFYATPGLARTIEVQGRQKQWVANRVGISPSLLTLVLGRRRSASKEVAHDIATALGSDVHLLFESLVSDNLSRTGEPR